MKLILIILFFITLNAKATKYYVDNAGSDAANGLTTGTAWQTANKGATTVLAGDSLLFKCGGTWVEKLWLTNSGTVSLPIYIGSYSTGAKPILTAFQTQGGFTNIGNIWTATATNSVKKLNTVLIDGKIRAMGRYPNTGYLTITSSTGDSVILTGLTGTPDYTGAGLVIRTARYIIDRTIITSQSTGTLNFSPKVTYSFPMAGYGYFIQNSPLVLDTTYEWAFDSTARTIKVYSTASPIVQISTIDTLCYLSQKNYITFDGLQFLGANKDAFRIDTSKFVTIKNCFINNTGEIAVLGTRSSNCTVTSDSIQNSLSNGVYLRRIDPYTPIQDVCDSAAVTFNYIKNTGMFAGMGLSDNGTYNAVSVIGTNTNILNNRIDSTGYIGIIWNGTPTLVKNNYVTTFLYTKSEGAAIYTFVGGTIPYNYNVGGIVRSNIVVGGIGNSEGGTGSEFIGAGIYMDGGSDESIVIDSNTVIDCNTAAVVLNGAGNINLRYNTIINGIGSCLYFTPLGGDSTAKNNIYYSKSSSQYCFRVDYAITQVGALDLDSNYFLRPLAQTDVIKRTSATFTLAAWTAAHPTFEAHSKELPTGITSATPLVYYNPTMADSTITLPGAYYDAKQTLYNNSITLHAFQSAILFESSIQVSVPSKIYTRITKIIQK